MPTGQQRAATLPSYPDLAGKVAVVTGGSGGIGGAVCRLLAAAGVRVAVTARHEAAIDTVVEELRGSGHDAIGVSADCTDAAAVARLRQQVEARLGPVEILAALVGAGGGRPVPVAETAEADWRALIDGSLTATYLTVNAFLPGMIERRRGTIITMASTAGRVPLAGPSAAYAAAKAGVIMFTRYLAAENGRHGIRANCIAPGTILTERLAAVIPEDRRRAMEAATALGRLGTPDDVALATLFLASDSSAWITGATLDVNGGAVMV